MNRQKKGLTARKTRMLLLAMCSVTTVWWGGTDVAAAAADGEEMAVLETVTVEAKRPQWEAKLSPGTVTVIRPEEYKGEQKELPELLKKVPGVHVREVNGKGQYTTVTVRGSTAAQVGIFVDGVLSNRGGDAAVDISTIPVKNVERIEVYRGYIPARFGGTFIGGVVNIVTKKPTKSNISAEVGKLSFGGRTASLEVVSPLGGGSLLAGINYETHDGDFPYQNYAAERDEKRVFDQMHIFAEGNEETRKTIANLHERNVDGVRYSRVVTLPDEKWDYYKQHEDAWLDYVRNGDMRANIKGGAYNRVNKLMQSGLEKELVPVEKLFKDDMLATGRWDDFKAKVNDNYLRRYKMSFADFYADELVNGKTLEDFYWESFSSEWYSPGYETGDAGTLPDEMKNKFVHDHVSREAQREGEVTADRWEKEADPDKNGEREKWAKILADGEATEEKEKRKYRAIKDPNRHRMFNDRKRIDGILKWQNNNWMVKGSWGRLNRHMPDSLWGDSRLDAVTNLMVDTEAIYYASSRRQRLDNKEILVQNRNQNGDLEWGWRVDYSREDKKYLTEIKLQWPDNFRWQNIPLREWSRYKSNKYNVQVDGSYRLSDRQMLDFQANYSRERLNVDGSLMDKAMSGVIGETLAQTRNKYDQEILNVQVQDSITLDDEGSVIVTPALRYNRSKIIGYSDGKRLDYVHFHWIHEKDTQTDDKVTWQLGIKKIVNDKLTLRATGGTYFRLLNMYEIAGDGAGILPAPAIKHRDGNKVVVGSVFPRPEYGRQFDMSVLWTPHDNNSVTMTYFWRNSDRMLMLFRAGLDFWSYYNDNRGKANGIELQTNWTWGKLSLQAQLTRTKMHAQQRVTELGYDYRDIWATYQPEWEGNLRLDWAANDRFSVFGEVHYTDEYFTNYGKDKRGGEYSYWTGAPVPSLTTVNLGLKWKPKDHWQLTFGCNDVFNAGPQLKMWSKIFATPDGYINPDYVVQGRTYYGSIRYEF